MQLETAILMHGAWNWEGQFLTPEIHDHHGWSRGFRKYEEVTKASTVTDSLGEERGDTNGSDCYITIWILEPFVVGGPNCRGGPICE